MRVQVEISLDGEVDDLLDPFGRGRLAVDMEFADAAIISALVFRRHQVVDRWVIEPGLDVRTRPVGPDERHHPKPRGLCVHELVGALVRPAGGEDAGHAIAAENLQHLFERIERVGLLIVVQMGVENFETIRDLRGADFAMRGQQNAVAPTTRTNRINARVTMR